MAKSNIEMKKLAEVGATVRVAELKAELDSLYRHFPGLRADKKKSPASPTASAKTKRSRLTMTAAQKKAVSVRMKKYWAGRKAAEAKR